jgi:hypothetical protein
VTAIDPGTLTGKQLWLRQSGLPGGVAARGLWTDSTGATVSLQAGTNPVVDNGPDSTRLSMKFDTGFFGYARDMTGYANQEIWLLLKGVAGNVAPFDFGKDGAASHYPYVDNTVYDDAYTAARTSFTWAAAATELATWSVLRIKLTGAALEYWVNNTLRLTRASGCSSANIWSSLRLGGNGGSASVGWIAEAIAFDHNLTTTEAQGVYEYLTSPINPFADAFAAAGPAGVPTTVTAYDTSAWTTEASEPLTLPKDKTGWATFTPRYTGTYRLSTAGSNYDTGLAVYTGSAIGALTLVASDDGSAGSGNALLAVPMTGGTTYRIQVGAGAAAVTLSGLLSFSLTLASYDGQLLKGRATKVLDAQPGG